VRLYEHEAKKVFAAAGLAIPCGGTVISAASGIDDLDLEYPVMVKAMVLTGGRGKRGGVRKAANATEAKAAVEAILDLTIGEYPVERVLVEEAVTERGACYVGVTTNPANYRLIVMASAAGGVDIEETAATDPDAVMRREVPTNDLAMPAELAAEFGAFLAAGLDDGTAAADLGDAVALLYAAFQDYEGKIAEINPLIITTDGEVVAADAKMVIDDNSLYRNRKLFQLLGITESRHDS